LLIIDDDSLLRAGGSVGFTIKGPSGLGFGSSPGTKRGNLIIIQKRKNANKKRT